jgi:branched-chain amino acid transport system permease protein
VTQWSFWLDVLTEIWIAAIVVMSWSLLARWGVHSFGQSAFFGVASYTTAFLAVRQDQGFLVAALSGIGGAVLCSALFGLLLVRLRGLQFLLASLALAQVLWGLSARWYPVTGGDNGLPGVSRPVLGRITLDSAASFQILALAVFLLMLGVFLWLSKSSLGLRLSAIRSNEVRARTLGMNVTATKYATFLISGGLAGVAGVLRAYHNGFVGPQALSVMTSADAYLMGVLGGEFSLIGPMVGAAVLIPTKVIASHFTQYWVFPVGLLYLMTAVFMPSGLVAKVHSLVDRRPRSGQRSLARD